MKVLKIIPKNLLSRVVGEIVSLKKPEFLARGLRDWFVRNYHINMDEAEFSINAYPSLSQLFTRRLKVGARPLGAGLVHPCDANLTCVEMIESDTLIQAKGRHYNLNQLLGADEQTPVGEVFLGGAHLVYYLCPTDYHRVHSPIDGEVTQVVHVPGRLWPVNSWSVANIPNLFSINERVIFHIRTALGPVALVMVGATNVGKISVSFDPEIITNQRQISEVPFIKSYTPAIRLNKGDELGIFHMGSTVVLLYGPGMLNVLPPTGPVRMGVSLS